MFTIKELTEHLIKIQNLSQGLYDLGIEFSFAVGRIGPTPDSTLPGAMFGVSKIGLIEADQLGPNTVDAALVKPIKARARRKKPTPAA